MGKYSTFNYHFHKSNLDTLFSLNFNNSTWATCFQLNYAQIQRGSLSSITFSTNPKLTGPVLSKEIRCFSCPYSSRTELTHMEGLMRKITWKSDWTWNRSRVEV